MNLAPPVLCDATVDPMLRPGRTPTWKVIVNGKPPHGVWRVYEIQAPSETHAAQEGMRRFVHEMEAKPVN